MSDVGIYAAIEAEIIAAIGDLSALGVASVIPSASTEEIAWAVEQLAPEGGGNQGRLIGVLDRGATKLDDFTIAQASMFVESRWEISYAMLDFRGVSDDRATARTVMETIRDRLHYKRSSITGAQRYLWKSESTNKTEMPGLLSRTASYSLKLLISQNSVNT